MRGPRGQGRGRHAGRLTRAAAAEFEAAMQEIDGDGSGEVEFEEFLTWWGSKDRTGEQV